MSFQCKCKICRSNMAESIEFCRYCLQWEYSTIIDAFCEDIDNLNAYNLSNHFNNHVNRETAKFWRNLQQTVGLYEPNGGESS